MNIEDIQTRMESLRYYWKQFLTAQNEIEMTADDEELEQLEKIRNDVEDMYIATESTMKTHCKLGEHRSMSSSLISNKQTMIEPVTASISFTPFHEEENFTNFVKRFENSLYLKNIEDDNLKLYTLLHDLPPKLYEILQDLVSPEDPYEMIYDSVVLVLKEHLEPSLSIFDMQHRFVCCVQQHETIKEYSLELKKLAKTCEFKCDCGKSVCDLLLRMQFVRGLQDTNIKGQLLQKNTTII